MPDVDTAKQTLPLALEPAAPRPSLLRHAPAAAFVSQLLAERAHLPPQRAKRRGSPEGAVGAYASGARIADRRMPAGFRKTLVV